MDHWGTLASGDHVERIALSGGGLSASIITFGASLQDLRLDGHGAPLILGFEALGDYERHSAYFGATVGRFANRIAGGRFAIDATEYVLDKNDGDNCLHGGSAGFSHGLWTVSEMEPDHVVLSLESADGDMGFPGNVTAQCRYELGGDGELRVTLTGETDAPTVCAMAHHSYFNLEDGGETGISDHAAEIAASEYLPVDDRLIPAGGPAPVEGTPFDFRKMARFDRKDPEVSYDHNFCIDNADGGMRQIARVRAPRSGVDMTVISTEPGLQLFTAPSMQMSVPGLGRRQYGNHAGFCMETQIWPDAPNRPDFPSALLNPGERREQRTIYRFQRN